MDKFGARAVMAVLALSFSLAANATQFASPVRPYVRYCD
jgi:hypothetical protein